MPLKTVNDKKIKGISIINPDEIERDYYMECINYAIKNNINHIQITGPIHDMVKGNVDGMIFNKKYSEFNNEKDSSYVNLCLKVINEGLEKSHAHGIKTYMWHHELILPDNFKKVYKEVLNENNDIEISHPLVKDYIENKIKDFFDEYPKMNGIVLTLHETKIPILKLRNQKLSVKERIKYITKILYDICNKLGKEVIVRPFASIEKDQEDMLNAYADISKNMLVMDKWTKFDWSLVLPHNDFFKKITKNPFIIETDIFGEYFGLGKIPIMLKKHIVDKVNYCNTFNHNGFVSRIDRDYNHVFGSVNEVNLVIMHALTENLDLDTEINNFFENKYGKYGDEIRCIMEETEDIQKKIFYSDGYYFVQGSYFPTLNHSINHFFFELMKKDCSIASEEWFLPLDRHTPSIQNIFSEKEYAEKKATEFLSKIQKLKNKIKDEEFNKLIIMFKNLLYIAKLWKYLAHSIYSYTKYFEENTPKYEDELYDNLNKIDEINKEGLEDLKVNYYNYIPKNSVAYSKERTIKFSDEVIERFQLEKEITKVEQAKNLLDYIICGSALEGHNLQKEVNFSDTLVLDGICRIPGNSKGAKWSSINAHGWFSYELKVNRNLNNNISITMCSMTDVLNVIVTIDGIEYKINEKLSGKKTYNFNYKGDKDSIRIRFDRVDGNTPLIYNIEIH